jgi:hypothetical protein
VSYTTNTELVVKKGPVSMTDLEGIAAARNTSLVLPKNISVQNIGMVARLLQALATWAYNNPNGEVIIYTLPENTDAMLEGYCERPHGIVAFLLGRKVISQHDKTDLTTKAQFFARKALQRQEVGNLVPEDYSESPQGELNLGGDAGPAQRLPSRGTSISIICADEETTANSRWLYSRPGGTPQVRSAEEFVALPLRQMKHDTLARSIAEAIPLEHFYNCGSMLHELFSNTHKWARTEIGGEVVRNSIRGINSRVHLAVDMERQLQQEDTVSPIGRYLRNLGPATNRLLLYEVSVFDTGPGLASRMKDKEISESEPPEVEYSAIMECLKKGMSSSGQIGRGIGLYKVLKTLTASKGLLLLRSGRMDLYRDFTENGFPLAGKTEDESYFLLDSFDTQITPKKRIKGTLVTLLVPIFVA